MRPRKMRKHQNQPVVISMVVTASKFSIFKSRENIVYSPNYW